MKHSKEPRLVINCSGFVRSRLAMSKILLFYRNFGLDQGESKFLTKNAKGASLVFYRISFSLEPAREVGIFLGFAFQPSESM